MKHGYYAVCVESDAEGVIRAINGQVLHSSYLDTLVQDIRRMVPSFTSISFTHVYREANNVAHCLAKYSGSHDDVIWVGCIPMCFNSCIRSDILSFLFE